MDSRDRLVHTLSFKSDCPPPRYESEFAEEVIDAWRRQGALDHRSPEEFFALDFRESLGIAWRRTGADKRPLECEDDLETLRRAYDPASPERFPDGFEGRVRAWQDRDFALFAAPWNEGFLQVIGISDGDSLSRTLITLCERPALAEAAMAHYAGYVETMLDRILPRVKMDYAVFYEPIASNHASVLSPSAYARFVQPALSRVVACLEKHGVGFRILWSAGAVDVLIPLWLDAGINGLYLNQAGSAGISYMGLRRQFGEKLLLFGGIDWRVVTAGPPAIDEFLEREVRPLLRTGGYVPYLDDTVRVHIPFEHFHYYRQRLDAIAGEVEDRNV